MTQTALEALELLAWRVKRSLSTAYNERSHEAIETIRAALTAPVGLEWREGPNKAEELQTAFDLRWKADMRAIERWQAAHPGNNLVWPDHADMVVWLMDQMDMMRRGIERVAAIIGRDRYETCKTAHDHYDAVCKETKPILEAMGMREEEGAYCFVDADERFDQPALGETFTTQPNVTELVEASEELIEAVAKIVHDEDETYDTSWPEGPDDDGYRGDGGYLRLPSQQEQDAFRHTAGLILKAVNKHAARAALSRAKGG